jgi:hypothetical protein
MPYTLNREHVAVAFSSGELLNGDEPVAMKAVEVGPLIVTSQVLAASDPFVVHEPAPFTQSVPNGRHPVTLAIANYGTDERVAFARVLFSDQPPVSWQMAVTELNEGLSTLGPDEFFGYGVDAGTGCFMDPAAGKLLSQRATQDENFVEDVMVAEMDKTYLHTRSWVDIRPIASRDENIICFSSGFGDGSYPSFFGFDVNGEVCQLITDFCLFHEETTQPSEQKLWWEFWK